MLQVWQPARAGCDRLQPVCRPAPCSSSSGIRGGQGSRAGSRAAEPPGRFMLHQRWYKNFSAKACEGHVLLVEVTKEFFAAHKQAVRAGVLTGALRGGGR